MPANAYIANTDYFALTQGINYLRIYCAESPDFVILVAFSETSPKREVTRITFSRERFESGLRDRHISHRPDDSTLPPYLSRVEGMNCDLLDFHRRERLRSDTEVKKGLHGGALFATDVAKDRLLNMAPLIARKGEILSSRNPEKLINAFAKSNGLNSTRTRLFFYTYLAYSENVWSLLPATIANGGQWDPFEKPDGPTLGRRRVGEAKSMRRRLTLEVVKMMCTGYEGIPDKCQSLRTMHGKVLEEVFEAKVIVQDGKKYFQGDDRWPLPSFRQFQYRSNAMRRTVKRSELYELVWTRPVTKVAQDIGISDVGLSKLCARYGIPVPPRGHWVKVAGGRKSPITRLGHREFLRLTSFGQPLSGRPNVYSSTKPRQLDDIACGPFFLFDHPLLN